MRERQVLSSTKHEVHSVTCMPDNALAIQMPCRPADSTTYYCPRREQIDQRWFDSPAESLLSIPVNFGMNSPFTPAGAIAGSVLPIRRAEELIATLPGVLSVRIVPSDAGAIDEVHVLTTDAVAPKQTVRNIESALIAELGLRVNHRKISIATTLDPTRAADTPQAAKAPTTVFIPPAAAAPSLAAAPVSVSPASSPTGHGPMSTPSAGAAATATRGDAAGQASASRASTVPATAIDLTSARRMLVFEDVELRRSRERGLTCRVTLTQGERAFAGEAKGPASERSRIDLTARATVLAMLDALSGMGSTSTRTRSLSLEGTQVVEVFGREFVFVSVAAREGRETVMLTGSCEVQESAETSTVLAVLNATNRWMQLDR